MCVTMELKFGNYEKEKKTINEYSLKPDLKPGDVCWVCRASDCFEIKIKSEYAPHSEGMVVRVSWKGDLPTKAKKRGSPHKSQ